ncbi:MAG: hypothetical protein Q8Q35_00075 [Nanoarchaeota archaeon]|nr:hypothetical protein [Nanoarchaeota archaeon]
MVLDTITLALLGSVLLNIALFIFNIKSKYRNVEQSSGFAVEKTKIYMLLIASLIFNGILIYLLVKSTGY